MALMALSLGFVSCSDTWDDHYDERPASADKTLLQLIKEDSSLSDFLQLLQNTHLYNNNHRTNVTYADLLDCDQSLTVWAPKNGTFDIESLLKECVTEQGDSMTGQHIVGNHIAHTLFLSTKLDTQLGYIRMHNNKQIVIEDMPSCLSTDIPARNGLLNIVGEALPYSYNLYECLTSMDNTAHIGRFLKKYERQELDENASIQRGIEDGKKVYSDSVMIRENILFRTFGKISDEDSSYVAFLPTEEIWKDALDEASPYFYYGEGAVADSISQYWKNLLLMQDLFYNWNEQTSISDSIRSTSYSSRTPEYNVYYRPLSDDGILSPKYVNGEQECSNGTIYHMHAWPFTKEQLYFRPVKVEGEREANIIESKDCTFNNRSVRADSVSGNGYLDIVPRTATSNWTATFEIANTLSGTYDICAVILPKTVFNAFSRDVKPNKFIATLNYVDSLGNKSQAVFKEEKSNDPYRVDTVTIGRFTLPVCNYGQPDSKVSLQLQCSVKNSQVKFSREMYLDCVYLKPVRKEEGK